MEVYAGFLEYTDHHIGRLIDLLARLHILDDTLVYYIFGDNGASAEGTFNGVYNEWASLNGLARTPVGVPGLLLAFLLLYRCEVPLPLRFRDLSSRSSPGPKMSKFLCATWLS